MTSLLGFDEAKYDVLIRTPADETGKTCLDLNDGETHWSIHTTQRSEPQGHEILTVGVGLGMEEFGGVAEHGLSAMTSV